MKIDRAPRRTYEETFWGGAPTHVRLDELRTLLSDFRNQAKHVHFLLGVHHVDHAVNHDERARPTDAGAGGGVNIRHVNFGLMPSRDMNGTVY